MALEKLTRDDINLAVHYLRAFISQNADYMTDEVKLRATLIANYIDHNWKEDW